VLYGYQAMFSASSRRGEEADPVEQDGHGTERLRAGDGESAVRPAATASAADDVAARDIVVESADRARDIHDARAALKSWQLKKYRDDHGRPYELIAGHLPQTRRSRSRSASMTRPSRHALDRAVHRHRVEWQRRLARAVRLRIRWPPRPEDFFDRARQALRHQRQRERHPRRAGVPTTVKWGPALGSGIIHASRSYNPPPQPIFFKDNKVSRVAPAKIAEQPSRKARSVSSAWTITTSSPRW
jgi:hypothetical protein